MLNLNDKNIRQALIKRLQSQSNHPQAIIEELRVQNGNAIADVVALYKDAHCFEIKGDGDKIERILCQGNFYNSSFMKITIVTTEKHLSKTLKIAPDYWGIMVAFEFNDNILFRYIRGAQCNPEFDKDLALLTLWKSEMLNLLKDRNLHKTKPRDFLVQLISNTKKKSELSKSISSTLIKRYSTLNY